LINLKLTYKLANLDSVCFFRFYVSLLFLLLFALAFGRHLLVQIAVEIVAT